MFPVADANSDETIRVMSFNMNGMEGDFSKRASEIMELVSRISPDVVFLTEFCEQDVQAIDTLMRTKYSYSSTDLKNVGSHFYSKYPIGKQRKVKGYNSISCAFSCDVYINNDTIVLYGCHFTSNNYNENHQYITPDSLSGLKSMVSYLTNTQKANYARICDAIAVADNVRGKKHPIIVMGDMNDVGGSGAIRTLERVGIIDAWWTGGIGYGATIVKPIPYRIDHIMYSPQLKLKHIDIIDAQELSDHNALYAVFRL